MVETYLTNTDRAHIEKMPAFRLTKGRACFITFGHIAIVIGVDGTASSDGTISYSVSPILEHQLMLQVGELIQSEVKAYLLKSIAKKLKIFRDTDDAKAFKKWDIGGVGGGVPVDSDSGSDSRKKRSPKKRPRGGGENRKPGPCIPNSQDGG